MRVSDCLRPPCRLLVFQEFQAFLWAIWWGGLAISYVRGLLWFLVTRYRPARLAALTPDVWMPRTSRRRTWVQGGTRPATRRHAHPDRICDRSSFLSAFETQEARTPDVLVGWMLRVLARNRI
uniref:Uncharacterized protein n=1 Tax=Ixodes ricinus TaxID=34613 RepID=A0A6B0UPE1_IXORI